MLKKRSCPSTDTPLIAAVDIPDHAIFDFDGLRVAVFKDASVFVNIKDIAARVENAIDKSRSRFNRLVRTTFLEETLLPLIRNQSLARDVNKFR